LRSPIARTAGTSDGAAFAERLRSAGVTTRVLLPFGGLRRPASPTWRDASSARPRRSGPTWARERAEAACAGPFYADRIVDRFG
jgi:hypothetical protein